MIGSHCALRAHECQKWSEVAAIGGAQSDDVGVAASVIGLQVETAGSFDRGMVVDFLEQNIGCDADMATIPVREQVNLHHAVMKARGCFKGRENIMILLSAFWLCP